MAESPMDAHAMAVSFASERIMAYLLDPEHVARPTSDDLVDDIEDALILAGDPDG